mgnify:FL=1
MARYEAESIKFGEALRDDLKKQRQKEAKEQESFAKKIAVADFAVKGVNTFLKNRVDTFNASMLDEKAYLTTAQANAANILNTKKSIDTTYNGSVTDYMSDLIANQWQTSVEKNVEGMSVQTVDKSGNVVTRQAFDVPIATLKNMTNFKIGNKEYASYEDMLNERVEQFNNLVVQAKSVPSDTKDIETYLERYANQEMPSNIVGFLSRPIKRYFKGETKETLRDKVNKTAQENLNSPLFSNFQQFQGSFEAYNKEFDGAGANMVKAFEEDLRLTANGVLDKKYNKIIKDIKVEYKIEEQTTVDPTNNLEIKQAISVPHITTTNVDNSINIRKGEGTAITTGKQLLVTFNAPLMTAFNSQLNPVGKEAWAEYQVKFKKAVSSNPMQEFAKFIESGIQNNKKQPNKYLNGLIQKSEILEVFLGAVGKDLIPVIKPPVQGDESNEQYAQIMINHRKMVEDRYREIAETIGVSIDSVAEQMEIIMRQQTP